MIVLENNSVYFPKVVKKLMDAVEDIEITDPNTMKLTVSTLEVVATASNDMPLSAQRKLLKTIQKITSDFEEISQISSKEESMDIGEMIFSLFLNVMSVSQAWYKHDITVNTSCIIHGRVIVYINFNFRAFIHNFRHHCPRIL